MIEAGSNFTAYIEDPEIENAGKIESVEDAERVSDSVVEILQRLRNVNEFEDVSENRNSWTLFHLEFAKKLGYEVDGAPRGQREQVVYAAYMMEEAKAIETYLWKTDLKKIKVNYKERRGLEEQRLLSLAAGEQAAAAAIYKAGNDAGVRREIAALFVAVGITEWGKDIDENLVKIRRQEPLLEKKMEEATGLLRGVTGHAAAIEIVNRVLDCKSFSPSADLDGKRGLDIGSHHKDSQSQHIEMVTQVKARKSLDTPDGIVITPVFANEDEKLDFVPDENKDISLPPNQRIANERYVDIVKLQRGMLWLKSKNFTHINSRDLVGLLVELQSSSYGKSLEQVLSSKAPMFDISTGICNDSILKNALSHKEHIEREFESQRNSHGRWSFHEQVSSN